MKNSVYFLLLLFLGSCIRSELPEIKVIDLPQDELNSKLIIDTPRGWNDFKLGNTITLTIKNISSDTIIFDPYYGVRVFVFEDRGEWREVDNQLISLTTHDVTLEPVSVDTNAMGTTSILPKISERKNKILVRIFVIGYIYENKEKTDLSTGASIDIVLVP
jgi:hypothetical protein